jgi:monomeric sarcosine oxidase
MSKQQSGGTQESPLGQTVAPPSGGAFDVIVVGGGTIGLSAAYYAAARGLKPLLLEQYDFANRFASSGGASRMFRIMYSPEFMVRLAENALGLWKEIEVASGVEILLQQPLLFYGDAEQTVEGNLGELKTIMGSLGVPFAWYPTVADLMQNYPIFQKGMPSDYVGLMQPNSAVIRAERSILAFESLARNAGAVLVNDQPTAITTISTEGPYQVKCPGGVYSAPQLILCPGAWTNKLLKPFNIQLNLTIWQMTVAYFRGDISKYNYPMWYEFGPPVGPNAQQQLFYGFPPDEVPGHLKVSADFTNNIYTDPDDCTYQPDPKILSALGTFLAQRFNGVSPQPTQASMCLYTMTPDAQMILDRLPGYHNVSIFTGASGRGFKFTPLFGRILVELATSGKTSYDIGPFSITRPGIFKSAT